MNNKKKIVFFVARNWALIFLFLLIGYFSVAGENFFSIRNFNNILIAATATLLLAAGETFVIISGGIDLSSGFVMGFVAVSSATIMQRLYARGEGYPELVCILIGGLVGILLGLFPGLVNGVLVAKFRVPAIYCHLRNVRDRQRHRSKNLRRIRSPFCLRFPEKSAMVFSLTILIKWDFLCLKKPVLN